MAEGSDGGPAAADELAWQRAAGYAGKLVEAFDRLDDAGGLARLSCRWSPRRRARARAALAEALDVLAGQVGAIGADSPPPSPATPRRSGPRLGAGGPGRKLIRPRRRPADAGGPPAAGGCGERPARGAGGV